MSRRWVACAVAGAGLALLVVGVALVSVPAAFMVAGVGVAALGLVGIDVDGGA